MNDYKNDVNLILKDENALNDDEKARLKILSDKIGENTQIKAFFTVLINAANRGITIPSDLLSKQSIDYPSHLNIFESNYLIEYFELISQAQRKLFKFSLSVFTDTSLELSERLQASKIVLFQIEQEPHFLDYPTVEGLKLLALIPHSNGEMQIQFTALHCLKSISYRLSVFIKLYYKTQIRHYLTTKDEAEITNVDKYFNASTNKPKFKLLQCLSLMISNNLIMDLAIFDEFEANEWRKELLSYTLVGLVIDSNAERVVSDNIAELTAQIDCLSDFITQINSALGKNDFEVEAVLQILISEIVENKYSIFQLNRFLKFLQADVGILETVTLGNYVNLGAYMAEEEIVWLAKECAKNNLDFTEENVRQFHKIVEDYDLATVSTILSKDINLIDLIEFFNTLNDLFLTPELKDKFLRRVIRNVSEISFSWKFEMYSEAVDVLMQHVFPYYQYNTRKAEKESYLTNDQPIEIGKNFTTYAHHDLNGKNNLNNLLKNEQTDEDFKPMNNLLNKLHTKLTQLLVGAPWTIPVLIRLVESLDYQYKIIALTKAIGILVEYTAKEESQLVEVIYASTEINIVENIHKYVIRSNLPESTEKNVEELINEICKSNENIDDQIGKKLLRDFRMMTFAYDRISGICSNTSPISSWTAEDIKKWAVEFKSKYGHQSYSPEVFWEKIAVLKRAVSEVFKFPPRDIKILSLLMMLRSPDGKGILAQINTGEGKTLIVSMLAAFHALDGHQVDIVTSSPVLAIPQSKEQAPFYKCLDLTSAHNVKHNKGYNAIVCYGTAHQFQADILRDEYGKQKTRRDRKCDIVIVDEVDNMLVDLKNHIVLLSKPMPGMNHMEVILAAIVFQINYLGSRVREIDGQTYFVDENRTIDEENTIRQEDDEMAIPVDGTVEEFVTNSVTEHVESLCRFRDGVDQAYPALDVPKHLVDFCKNQIPKWIKNAILANGHYANRKHYIIRNGKIAPVDVENTGVVEDSMHWNEGLHQFLEIKHGAKINVPSLTSNYISNVGYFLRYGKNIYGMTGTLGNERTKRFLNDVYALDSVIIPPFKTKVHKELTAIVVDTSVDDWYWTIAENCVQKLRAGRAVLIIMKYIEQNSKLKDVLTQQFQYPGDKIKLYSTDEESDITKKRLEEGDVIITTNIAGRGTDIKVVEQVNANGGLHVCLTFLPLNERVELQNIGRTSRTGNRGTSQLILHDVQMRDIRQIKIDRDRKQDTAFNEARKQVTSVVNKDEIFKLFCKLLDDIKGQYDDHKKYVKEAVEERFAIWLEINDGKMTNEPIQEFKKFESEVLKDDTNNTLMKNPYFHVLIGNEYLKDSRNGHAIKVFTAAIMLDENFAENAYYNRGFALIAKYGKQFQSNKDLIHKAVDDFKKARDLINKRKNEIYVIQKASTSDAFTNQVNHKLHLYDIQLTAINTAIGHDKLQIDEDIQNLEKAKTQVESSEVEKIEEQIKNLKEDKKIVGTIQKAEKKKHGIKIEHRDLKDSISKENLESYMDEVKEAERNGYKGAFKITEIIPIDWWSVIGLMIIGLVQIIAGVLLIVLSTGQVASFGMSLLMEGASDIVTAIVEGIIFKNFSWETWAIQKAISYAISIICAGLGAVKNAIRMAKHAFDVGKTLIQDINKGVQTIRGAVNIVKGQVIQTGKKIIQRISTKSLVLAAKKVSIQIGKTVAKDLTERFINYASDKLLLPLIKEEIFRKANEDILESLKSNPILEKMLRSDQNNKNNTFENMIIEKGFELLKVENKPTIESVFTQISLGVISARQNNHVTSISAKIEAIKVIPQLVLMLPEFIMDLNIFIEEKYEEHKMLLQDHKGVNQNSEEEKMFEEEKIDRTPENISEILANELADSAILFIRDKIFQPTVRLAVNHSYDKLAKNVQSSIETQIHNHRAQRNIIIQQRNGNRNKKTKVPGANSQNTAAIQQVEHIIKESKTGPAGLLQLGAISDVIDRPIEVYSKGRHKFTIGKNKTNDAVKIQYEKPQPGFDVGHFTRFDGKIPKSSEGGKNMSLYNTVADQAGLSGASLKAETLNVMEKNKIHLSRQFKNIKRLEMYDRAKLMKGGTTPNTNREVINNHNRGEVLAATHIVHSLHNSMMENSWLARSVNLVLQNRLARQFAQSSS